MNHRADTIRHSNNQFTQHSIEIANLSKSFDQFQLKDVNLTLPKGSIMGFIGENGAGKTTTIKLILNQLKADAGKISILGYDHIREEKKLKEEIGVVFDESYFHDNIKPKHISKIMERIYRNWDCEMFSRYLKAFRLPEDKITKDFSRGMKMKLSLATALSHHPKLLILDEPTSGLDPVIRNEILDIFLDFIQDEEHSILFSSHITSDLEKVADYITFLHEGTILFSESKDELLADYGLLLCGTADFSSVDKGDIIGHRENRFGHEMLIRKKDEMSKKYKGLTIDSVTLEDIMLFYVKGVQLK
ncbi:ABC transporter ATP-binding protein [Anoxybacterium hadale]|uniref:ABC transporter ATP-binding protein n=1 Tax=Anoxybacterium hadale TaxID=3408580 RepID=A0ACD1A7U3_9FIRM|nr:ABC transporter ATP-binding protein [Clostridiales bacterium]